MVITGQVVVVLVHLIRLVLINMLVMVELVAVAVEVLVTDPLLRVLFHQERKE